ncbi:MAG: serine--tRNA ligase [Isosphaeraceae bacterium]|jgi:seryl-tRNA synthetase|nr:MAG: serine--tRNA ligase [Isosphaeraceae bacterium]
MIDLKLLLADPAAIRRNCQARRVPDDVTAEVDRLVELEARRKAALQEVEELRRRQNEIAQATGKEKDPARRNELIAEGKRLKEEATAREEELRTLEAEVRDRLMRLPNLTHPEAPVGGEDASRELRRWGEPRRFDFTPKDHVEIGKALDILDFEAGGKVTGHGFYFLKGDAVLLDLALQQYALQMLIREGFRPIITPDLARNAILEGIGFQPRGPETQVYSIEGTDLSLIGTAEITLGGLHADEILDAARLPLKYVGISHCFRTEAGAGGRVSKGLYRVHQFTKVEMFAFTEGTLEASGRMHQELLRIEEAIFQGLGLPYRVLDIASGDLGGPAYRKFDIEAWMPGRGDAGEYGEVTSTSDCTDYQARRLNIRYKQAGQKGTRFVHTLNGTAIAVSRALLAILENYQRADGTVDVPEVLQPWVGKTTLGA